MKANYYLDKVDLVLYDSRNNQERRLNMWPEVGNLNPPKNKIDPEVVVNSVLEILWEIKRCFSVDDIISSIQESQKIDSVDQIYKDMIIKFLDSQVNDGVIEEYGRPGVYRRVGSEYEELPVLREKPKEPRKCIAVHVANWLSITEGYFTLADCYRGLKITGKKEKAAVRQVLHRMHKDRRIERHALKQGSYRSIDPLLGLESCIPVSQTIEIKISGVCPHCQKNVFFKISTKGE
jgi:hypothetical protein